MATTIYHQQGFDEDEGETYEDYTPEMSNLPVEEELMCEIEGCGFPVSECIIDDHPPLCGQHLEEWFLARVKRISQIPEFWEDK